MSLLAAAGSEGAAGRGRRRGNLGSDDRDRHQAQEGKQEITLTDDPPTIGVRAISEVLYWYSLLIVMYSGRKSRKLLSYLLPMKRGEGLRLQRWLCYEEHHIVLLRTNLCLEYAKSVPSEHALVVSYSHGRLIMDRNRGKLEVKRG